jgi:ribose-phosphate pyrophosphokinase
MIKINQEIIAVGHFPAGEQKLFFNLSGSESGEPSSAAGYQVEWIYEAEDELVTLIYLCNHIKSQGGILDTLYMPYLPNARMDRVKEAGEVFTLEYFCRLINDLGFPRVYVNNPHSEVCMSMLDNAVDAFIDKGVIRHNNDVIQYLIRRLGLSPDRDILFYPDQGCAGKYEGVIPFPALSGQKSRDWNTGRIEGLEVLGEVPEGPFNALIVDDICSYGGTFLRSARKLKELGADTIWLYVTHCENSVLKGELIGSGLLERIFTTRSIFTAERSGDLTRYLDLIEIVEGIDHE